MKTPTTATSESNPLPSFKEQGYGLPEIKISVSMKHPEFPTTLYPITCSRDCADFARMCFNADEINWREEMVMVCLNRKNEIVGFYKVGLGGISGCVCDPKIIFTVALNCAASSIIVAHNHPSGTLTPSGADKDLTQKLKKAGAILDIPVLDHIIVTHDSYYSFMDNGDL